MNWVFKCTLARAISGMLGVVLLVQGASAGSHKERKYRYSDIDMPVSLAVGTVRTPEFAVRDEAYFIMLQAEKRLPFKDMQCMMGMTSGPLEFKDCTKEQLVQADWTVFDDGHIVAQGSSSSRADDMYTDKHLFKFLGKFVGVSGKKYVVEVKFTKDGTPLNAANPHLIVILVRYH